jgi:phosphate starvation-inducible protein PhoH and related proteins
MAIAGDLSQVDLPNGVRSGLHVALNKLERIQGIGVVRFDQRDIVRHPLVARIVGAWDEQDKEEDNP